MKFSKITLHLLLTLTLAFGFTACDDDDDDHIFIDNEAPSAPTNLKIYTGDGELHVTWDFSPEEDVDGYSIYESDDNNNFTRLTDVNYDVNYYIDSGLDNGRVVYYAVTAFDASGNESDLSLDEAVGITRPEGKNQVIKDYLRFPGLSGFTFNDFSAVSFDSDICDFFFENYENTYYINVWDDSELQDMGSTQDIYEIEFAPDGGWIPLVSGENVKYTEAIIGHTYVIWTFDGYYGKIRINSLTGETMSFDWAFQLLEGEKMLKASGNRTIKRNISTKDGVKKLDR
ncbi:MAG: fibronectin type III domain-containing protein [Melioribacteraceae bacterium]|nr:fibronectin type III domain-containing protein [Melioribacteraceae bacterium]